jgi:diacylglycerol kinase (ATP)
MDSNVIIANERAYWGLSRRRVRRAMAFFNKHKFPFTFYATQHLGHAQELAVKAATEKSDTIIVIGGDGTLNEVINGCLSSGCDKTPRIGIIPSGSSNDFSKSVGIPQRLQQACRTIVEGRTRQVDIGRAGEHYFCTASSIGLFSQIAMESKRMKGLSGSLRYMAAAIRMIGQMDSGWEMTINADGRNITDTYTNLLINNTPRFGGMIFADDAQYDDGILDCMLIETVNKRQALHMATLTLGKSLKQHRKVTLFQVKSLSISLDRPALLCNDGEVIAEPVKEIEYGILPKGLQIIF